MRAGWGWTYSQAGTATVSLHGERKWALEKGGGEGAGSEIDFMPESDTAPSKG